MMLVSAVGIAALVSPAARQEPSSSLAVMTFNIQHGIDGAHHYDLQRAIDTIARARPDLVGLQEVTRNHPYYNCDDQPKRLAEGLERATGQRWNVVYEQEWFTPNVECWQSRRGDGKETEGLAFLSPLPLGSTHVTDLPASRIALTVKFAGAGGLPITVTHFASGADHAAARAKEADALAKWTAKLGDPQILLGDFNAQPDAPDLQALLRVFRDAWRDAVSSQTAKGTPGTHGASRIDDVLFKAAGLEVASIETIDTAGWFGAAASDHKPVIARFHMTSHRVHR
jgi:endonuclease/exonuclease/phosphatase family metal-dependent hydrolase